MGVKKTKMGICLLIMLISFSCTTVVLAATHYVVYKAGYYKSTIPINSSGISTTYSSY